jgi:hypothetical protein
MFGRLTTGLAAEPMAASAENPKRKAMTSGRA